MGEVTAIEWTMHTLNPWIGCTQVSPGCDKCYAKTLAERYGWVSWGAKQPRKRTAPATWNQAHKWNRQATAEGRRHRVFCASLADVFDAEVPDEWRADLWELIRATPMLDWQLLTKRPNLIRRYLPADWGPIGWPNVWLGTTVESQAYTWRVEHLCNAPCHTRFLSCEPLLGPLDLSPWLRIDRMSDGGWWPKFASLAWVHWVIVGGESGPGHRPLRLEWARDLRDQCAAAEVPLFFKQVGGPTPKAGGKLLDGREWCEFPQPRELVSA